MHAIHLWSFPCKTNEKVILSECAKCADENGDYEGQITHILFKDEVKKNYEEAETWIRENDKGWYDNLAIKYKEGRRIMWLVKFEYHC